VVWADPDQAAIKGRVFFAGSETGGTEFVVNASQEPNTVRQRPAVCNVGDGLVAVWVEAALTPPGPRPQIKARRFDRDGRPVGTDIQVSLSDVDPTSRPAVTASGDGGFIVTWIDPRPDQRVQTRRFRPDGMSGGSAFTLSQTPGFHKDPMAIQLVVPTGTAVGATGLRAWGRDPASVEGPNLMFRFVDHDATPVDREIIYNLQGFRDEGEVSALCALDTGQFVLGHIRHRDNHPEPGVVKTSTVEWRVYQSDGKPIEPSGIEGADRLLCSCPRLTALPAGRFLLTWIQKSATTVDTTPIVRGRLYSVNGLSLPEAVTLTDDSAPDRRGLATGAIFDGDAGEAVLLAWTEVDRNGASSVQGRTVRFGPSGEVIP
jgi:hypothetical protein